MAISSDIVAEVVAAADPRRAANVRRRLESLSASDGGGFSQHVAPPQKPIGRYAVEMPVAAPPRANQLVKPLSPGETPASMAYRALGGVLLQKTFETMLPDLGGIGAKTSAASMWKSMLAQKLADTVSPSLFREQHFLAGASMEGGKDAAGSAGPQATQES